MPRLDVNRHIGKRLRIRRTMLGLSQQDVATSLRVAAQQVQKYEKGVNMLNVHRLYQFAGALNVPVAWFFEGMAHPQRRKTKKKKSARPSASDRESLEIVKSFKAIRNRAMRKRLADLIRLLSLKIGRR